MHRDQSAAAWTAICNVEEILPNTGVCALLQGQQVAVFRMDDGQGSRVFAIGNYDPNAEASVLSRGLVGNLGASPIYKHHFDLQTGECLEAPEHSVPTWPARIEGGKVWVGA